MSQPLKLHEVYRFKTAPEACPYLPAETCCMEHRLIVNIEAAEYEQMLMRGWRRFGLDFFRPACPSCVKCVNLRVNVAAFAPNKSQRRIQNKNSNVIMVAQRPTITDDHVRLWNDYHSFMRDHRGWRGEHISKAEYAEVFLLGDFEFAREFLYYDSGRLVAIGLVDVLPRSISSIYFFHEPAYRERALGVYSVLSEISFARQYGLEFNYLGYWVSECQSSSYKSQYGPHQLLVGFPEEGVQPGWSAKSMP
jgi:arginyl-tRNA--protein-N-Asp/Glu arginylyltransferase